MADEETQSTDNSPAEEAGEQAGDVEETKEASEDTSDKAEETAEEKTEDKAEDAEETEESDKEESDAPSEDDVPKGYHNDPKMQTYVERQKTKAVEDAKAQWEADNKVEEKPAPIVDKVAEAKAKLTKAYDGGTAEEITNAQAELNEAQIDARVNQSQQARTAQEAKTAKIDAEIVSVKADLTDKGVKDVDDLDKYLGTVDRSRGVKIAYENALDVREGRVKAKMSGEKVALKKSKSPTPGTPASESKSGIYKRGMSFDDIDRATEHIK